MKISEIKSIDRRFVKFEQFHENHPDANFFQSGVFYKFIEGTENYTPLLLIYEDENEIIRGSLLAVIQRENNIFLRYFSSGIIIRGGPLIDKSSDTKKILNNLVGSLINAVKNKGLFIQFRNFTDQQDNLTLFQNLKFKYYDHQNLITETRSVHDAWNNLSKNRKRQIRSSIEKGALVVENPTMEEFRQFYIILKELYKTKIHKPLPSWTFFHNFHEHIKSTSFGIIHLIKYKDVIIGGILCPVSKNKTVHEWYICGMDKQYKGYGVYPSVMATWSAIEYAAKNNFETFDFLGLGNPDNKYGVRDFKLRFGGVLVNYGRYERINNHLLYAIASTGYHVLKFVYSKFARSS